VLSCKQTCTTSNHTLIQTALQGPYVKHCQDILASWFPEGELASDSYGILSRGRIEHLSDLLDKTRGTIVRRGAVDLERGKMGISIVTDVPDDDVLMSEEIFGPIVVILTKEVMAAPSTS
jgi:acyl-CoA reductase-like NAD-dependent aldehyde dehydrogenase